MRLSLFFLLLMLAYGTVRAQTEDPEAYARRLNESPERDTAFDRQINEMFAEAMSISKDTTPAAREKIKAITDRLLTYADTSANEITAQKALIMSHPVRYHSGQPGYSIGQAMLNSYPPEVYREIFTLVYFGHLMKVTGRDYLAMQDSLEQLYARVADPDIRRFVASRFMLRPGETAPAIRGNTHSGEPFRLDSLFGQVVLMTFWATWCPPCIASFPEVERLSQMYADGDLIVVAVSLDEDRERSAAFLEPRDLNWIQVYDGGKHYGPIAQQYHTYLLPQYFLIDREGKIAYNSVFNGHKLPSEAIIKEVMGAR